MQFKFAIWLYFVCVHFSIWFVLKHNYSISRFIQQVNLAAVTIQRWFRRYTNRKRANENALKQVLASKKKVMSLTLLFAMNACLV